MHDFDDIRAGDRDPVAPELIARALTAGELMYPDGATQVFEPGGATTYVEHGRTTRGEWYVDGDGHFGSFWPPGFRAGYDLRWIVEDGAVTGVQFTDRGVGSVFEGRYRNAG
jgi:hypothetical protein